VKIPVLESIQLDEKGIEIKSVPDAHAQRQVMNNKSTSETQLSNPHLTDSHDKPDDQQE